MARADRETWVKRIERWRESGLSAKEFAAEIGVNAGTLMHWKYRLAAEARDAERPAVKPKQESVSFVEVKAATPVAPANSATESSFEVVVASGAIVRVPPHFDAAALRRLLDVIAKR